MAEVAKTHFAVRWGANSLYQIEIRVESFIVNEYVMSAGENQDVEKWKVVTEVYSSARNVAAYTHKNINDNNIKTFCCLCDNMEIGMYMYLNPRYKDDMVYTSKDVALETYYKGLGYLTASARVICDTFPDLEFQKDLNQLT